VSITSTDVLNIAPEFSSENVSRINIFIANAELFINRTVWGSKADVAHAYLTAHLLKSSPSSSGAGLAAGPVTMEKVGDLQRHYAGPNTVSSSQIDLASTPYGRVFEQMKRTLLITPIINS